MLNQAEVNNLINQISIALQWNLKECEYHYVVVLGQALSIACLYNLNPSPENYKVLVSICGTECMLEIFDYRNIAQYFQYAPPVH